MDKDSYREMIHLDEAKHAEALDWPYPVHHGKENEVAADVLVLGGRLVRVMPMGISAPPASFPD